MIRSNEQQSKAIKIMSRSSVLTICFSLYILSIVWQSNNNNHNVNAQSNSVPKPKILPKDPLYMTEMDVERLYEQWEDTDDDKLPPDELPQHKRPKPQISESMLTGDGAIKNPEMMMKMSKKGKTLMTFVTVDGKPSKKETEILTERWQVGLTNNHLRCERFVIADDRAIFVFEDGSLAFEAVDFLTSQPELKEYSIDNRPYPGKAYQRRKAAENKANNEKKSATPRSDL